MALPMMQLITNAVILPGPMGRASRIGWLSLAEPSRRKVRWLSRAGFMFVSQIFVYPIKSTRGIAVDETHVDISGPVRDRRWMLVDSEGLFLSQRKLPRMALIQPWLDGTDIVVDAPGMPSLLIPAWSGEGEWIPVTVWRDRLTLPHPKQVCSDWFSSFLGQTCRLVYLPNSVNRPVEAPFDAPEWRVSLADGFPLLLLTDASLDLLNSKLPSPVSVERFRPNFVISGAAAAHEEDEWRRLRIGSAQLAVVKPCARCSTVLVNPETAAVGIEPLRTLAEYRRRTTKVMFAQNALVVTPGQLRVGMPVEVFKS